MQTNIFLKTEYKLAATYSSEEGAKSKESWVPKTSEPVFRIIFSGLLWTGTLTHWFQYATNFRIRPHLWTDCKLHSFLWAFFGHYSSAILAIMSVEKFVALYYPLHAKRICNLRMAKRVSLTAAFIFIIANFYMLIVMKVGTDKHGTIKCTATLKGRLVLTYFNFIFYSLGPFVVLSVTNTLIVSKLLVVKYRSKYQNNEAVNQGISKSAVKGAMMLVSVSFTFIILTTPICIFFFGLVPSSEMIRMISGIMSTLNHSINGFLYCLFGSKFRKELIKLVCRCKHNRIEASTSENTVTNTASRRY